MDTKGEVIMLSAEEARCRARDRLPDLVPQEELDAQQEATPAWLAIWLAVCAVATPWTKEH